MTQKEALEILKMGHNVFVTGAAGSGKTFLINDYIKFLKQEKVGLGITASTGIAATHLGGTTIHSWSGMGIKDRLSRYDIEDALEKPHLKKRFDEARVLIIDEVSMLHDFQLDLVNQLAQAFKKNELPFGGLQVIFCGDFFQLPPVSSGGQQSRFAYHSPLWAEMDLKICYLSEQHRQSDHKFLSILNAIRDNAVSQELRGILQSRLEKKTGGSIEPTKLYSHNADVDSENERELAKLLTPVFTYAMSHKGRKPLVEAIQKSCLAPEYLRLKKGARVMFVKNNFEEGYVNGTLGLVEKCDETGIEVRTSRGKLIEVPLATWVIEENGEIKAQVTQYPLRLAWAITVHKSQGMSLDAAEVDLSKSFEPGMGYVALSRVRSLDGLSLLGLNEMALKVNEEVLAADQLFRLVSKTCREELNGMFPDEKNVLKKKFLDRVAGTAQKIIKAPKVDSIVATKNLLLGGLSIFDVAEARGLTVGTIIGHLEKIKEKKDKMDWSFISQTVPADRIEKIKKALVKSDNGKGEFRLSPAASLLGSDYQFDEIRLVRLLVS